MKKIICLLLLPILSLICLCGCGEDKSSNDLKILYESMVDIYVVDKVNKFFGDKESPNTISIGYTQEIETAIDSVNATTDIQKRYTALGYQQQILDYIFSYYENNHKDFYKVMSSGNYPNTEMNALYTSLESLKNSLDTFKSSYNAFIDATQNGISDVMEFNLTSYSYQLNKVIDFSFDFMYKFIAMYQNYGIEDYSKKTAANLQIKVDKTYVDIALKSICQFQ